MKAKRKNPTLSALHKVRILLERGWTQNVMARNSVGRVVGHESSAACRFCMMGAVLRASKSDRTRTSMFNALAKQLGLSGPCLEGELVNFNDDPDTHQDDVLKAVDGAIKVVKRRSNK